MEAQAEWWRIGLSLVAVGVASFLIGRSSSEATEPVGRPPVIVNRAPLVAPSSNGPELQSSCLEVAEAPRLPVVSRGGGADGVEADLVAGFRRVDQLGAEDAMRVSVVNSVLIENGMSPIPDRARISDEAIDMFRAVVDDAEAHVTKCSTAWLREAESSTRPLVKDLYARINAGQSAGLPVLSEENPMTRRHPHEAMTQVMVGGRAFVVRCSPAQNANLGTAGSSYDESVERRRRDYVALLVPLFEQ